MSIWRSQTERQIAEAFVEQTEEFEWFCFEAVMNSNHFHADICAETLDDRIHLYEIKGANDRRWLTQEVGLEQIEKYRRFGHFSTYIVDESMLKRARGRLPQAFGLISHNDGVFERKRKAKLSKLCKADLIDMLPFHVLQRAVASTGRQVSSDYHGTLKYYANGLSVDELLGRCLGYYCTKRTPKSWARFNAAALADAAEYYARLVREK